MMQIDQLQTTPLSWVTVQSYPIITNIIFVRYNSEFVVTVNFYEVYQKWKHFLFVIAVNSL